MVAYGSIIRFRPVLLPPLQTLRAFEATGRFRSMALAASELHVTPGAISRQIRALEDDLGVRLFRRTTRSLRSLPNWERWFAAAGVAGAHRKGPTLSHGSLVIEAALRGEGVALGRSALAADDNSAGRLVALFPDIMLPAGRGYDLVYRTGAADDPGIEALRTWLQDETAAIRAGADGI